MLGEASMTMADAARYRKIYLDAIHAVGKSGAGRGVYAGPGVSVKLSALHPRYSHAKYQRAMTELLPALAELMALAKRYDIGLTIDAEEADRLEISLDLLEALAFDPALAGWDGLGFVIQTVQKRAPFVVDWVLDLAQAQRAPHHHPPRQRRLPGFGGEAHPGRGVSPTIPCSRASRTRTSPTSPAPRSCSPSRAWSSRSSPRTTPSQTPICEVTPSWQAATAISSSSACTAWARPSTTR